MVAKVALSMVESEKIVPGVLNLPKIIYPQDLHDLRPGMLVHMAVHLIRRNKKQPRMTFDADEILALSQSLKAKGDVEVAVIVTLRQRGQKIIPLLVSGERRKKAAAKAGLVCIKTEIAPPMDDEELFFASVITNEGSVGLNPIEKALAYYRSINEFGRTQQQTAAAFCCSVATVRNHLNLLNLVPDVQDLVKDGSISCQVALKVAKILENLQIDYMIAFLEQTYGKGIQPTAEIAERIIEFPARNNGHLRKQPKQKGPRQLGGTEMQIRSLLRRSKSLCNFISGLNGISAEDFHEKGGLSLDTVDQLKSLEEELQRILPKISSMRERIDRAL